ncbi:MAG: hypothetical protein HUU02_15090, partial [Bacteroidetes bacterium]|nr:hypothetical protein [Bacteroidota bacterium]
ISEAGILPVISTIPTYQIDTATTGFRDSSKTKIKLDVRYIGSWPVNYKRLFYPSNLRIRFSNVIIDTALAPNPLFGDPLPVKFTVVTPTDSGEQKVPFTFFDSNGDSTLSYSSNPDEIKILSGPATATQNQRITWSIRINNAGVDTGTVMPTLGDTYTLNYLVPFGANDVFIFNTSSQLIRSSAAKDQFKDGPYVVPNPYVGAASFEPAPFGVQGRGDRRMEFRNLPLNATVRIYTVRGELVRTLTQDGSMTGVIPWDLRTKDNLDAAPGLYIFQVDAGSTGSSIGKFAIIK